MKVLLIEDDRLLAREIAKALREENCAVDVAANGEDGQHLGNSEAYDVAVLDLGLPKVPGVQVLRAWRKNGLSFPYSFSPRVTGGVKRSMVSRPAPMII